MKTFINKSEKQKIPLLSEQSPNFIKNL